MIKILNSEDAINRRLYKGMIIVETAIYRVWPLEILTRTGSRGSPSHSGSLKCENVAIAEKQNPSFNDIRNRRSHLIRVYFCLGEWNSRLHK
ncbi:hypothetical protein IQ276_012720 [Desmonostoc muscorum LEGE 12446]|uniref:Uncharacterized protein n=1 Tax=Desmonostoc muscorum LEGE 12446 TaxID=1828758 RepID=A0A8J6ZNK0_DESMC|nr:hypothetical protein [Desmonostoc muscorum]MCF2147265.1 hypothetical protein [Desmonostoc muscorum LEGE 12446]